MNKCLHAFQKKDIIAENGFQSGSSSCESDVSSANSSESNIESEEVDQEQNSDSSCNNRNKKSIQTDKFIGFESSSGHTTDQKKILNASDLAQNDKSAILPLEFSSSNQIQKNMNDENSNQSLHFLRGEENSSKVKNEIEMQNQITLPSMNMNDEMKHNSRYGFDTETKNITKDIDKFKMENEDEFIKHLDRDDINYNNSTKRSTSASNSPYKEKRRKFFFEKSENNHELSVKGTVHSEPSSLQMPIVKKMYYSYFERGCDDRDEIREIK